MPFPTSKTTRQLLQPLLVAIRHPGLTEAVMLRSLYFIIVK